MAKKSISDSFTNSLLKTGEVAQYCHTSIMQVHRWIKSGDLKAFQTPRGHRRITIEEFKKFLEKHNIPISEEIHSKAKKTRILIADDDDTLVRAISDMLQKKYNNIECKTAYDGYETLIKAGDFKPDLIILDIKMPKIDGLEVCRRLRENNTFFSGIRILAITAHAEAYDRATVLNAGADDYLLKPFKMSVLLEQIEKLIKNEYQ
ncbi:MAG: response regulator [Candidatus Latescibacteria bacterium]|nr:response regulator [Candidatus Latescibacterota bacterium]